MIDERILRSWAIELGFCELALCSAQEFADERNLVNLQAPLAERRQLRFDPESDHPHIRSLCVMLWPYQEAEEAQGDRVFVDSYYFASNAAYHAARALEERLKEAGHFAQANVSYPAKRAALRAGLGMIGRNDLLITPDHGTRVVIILMATDIPPSHPDQKEEGKTCLQCGRCSSVCPSGALGAQGMEHPQYCLRNYTMEGIVVPPEARKRMAMRLIGCDMCQRVCPMQNKADKEPGTASSFLLDDFMTTNPTVFSGSVARLAKEIGRNAARPQRVRAQAALLAGNRAKPEDLPVLREWALSEFEAVRAHALWAIERIESAQRNCQSDRT